MQLHANGPATLRMQEAMEDELVDTALGSLLLKVVVGRYAESNKARLAGKTHVQQISYNG